ncbi:TonB-dependent siderophore receptor [Alcanivorax sp. S71-1-4]|jgi:outer-membrane receptor for ferric coprogen and ferric-rhodotorulic acid|uniref:TonB-dependent siderophore receptor n=1 Tax=Alcanivorax sp. S71-1-4 TaxID=1177159 RepID=UPI001359CC07|nr:TonB-dependent siderophore receptor [Alcanivorax sp. S71-1-4]KAF0807489.1 TonB-dependent siderophore receptor [Alcanivorax sp. S71-1-4]
MRKPVLQYLPAALLCVAGTALAADTDTHELDTVDVSASSLPAALDASLATEGTGTYAVSGSSSATRLPMTLRETPQSVTVITRQQLDDFALDNIADVMRMTPGITVTTSDTERLSFFARGFQITNFLYDGMPSRRGESLANQAAHTDTVFYDRIEILRGATGLLNGIGNPSASINLVRKKPTRDFAGKIVGSVESWNGYRTELDVGGRLNPSGTLRGRVAAAYSESDSFLDHYHKENDAVYGVLEADLTDRTMLTLGVDSMNHDPRGSMWGALPLYYSDGSKTNLPRSTNPAAKWSSWAMDARTAFTQLDHVFENGWSSRLTYTRQQNRYDAPLASAGSGFPDPVTGAGMGFWQGLYKERIDQDTFDAYASGPFDLFGRRHELIIGASHSRSDRHYTGQSALGAAPTLPSIFGWNGNLPKPGWDDYNSIEDEVITQTGYYATARLKPTDALALILGTQIVHWKRELDSFATWNTPTHQSQTWQENGEVSPYVGVVYDLTDHHSVYASYNTIFKPQTQRDATNTPLDPEEGKGYEAGLKSEFNNGQLNTSVAVFRIEQDNLAENTGQPIPGGAPNAVAYRAVDGAVTEGVELEISGELLPRWQWLAGYTYRETRDADDVKINTVQPENLFRLNTAYRFAGELSGLYIGGSLSWQDETFKKVNRPGYTAQQRYTQSGYTLLGAMAQYDFSPALSATVNVTNLLDEKYYDNLGFYNGGYYGEPRKYSLRVSYRF